MKSCKEKIILMMSFLLIPLFSSGCVAVEQYIKRSEGIPKPEKTVASYEEIGKWWGTRHKDLALTPAQVEQPRLTSQCPLTMVPPPPEIDLPFVENLISKEGLDFFWVHSELKDAFKKGYRIGYEKRGADLVLGPHLTAAASCIGENTSQRFVNVITTFEQDWANSLKNAVDVFITLISEGSQADRENFIRNFVEVYTKKYEATKAILEAGGFMPVLSEGGTMLYIDVRKTVAVLEIPIPMSLKTEIYHQTFRVMGDEWGRRLSHNLIKRDELIDLLRRSRAALQEVPPNLETNLGIVYDAFLTSYGTDAERVFDGLIKDAGYTERPISKILRESSPREKISPKRR